MGNKIINELNIEIEKLTMNIDTYISLGRTGSLLKHIINIERFKTLSNQDLKKAVKKIIKIVVLSNKNNYLKYRLLEDLAQAIYPQDIDLAKLCIKKALKYADIPQMYGIANECYRLTHDKPFSTKIYKKAIKRCHKANNTSRFHLLGQSMSYIDIDGDDYFQKWGEEIKTKAKKINDENKLKAKK